MSWFRTKQDQAPVKFNQMGEGNFGTFVNINDAQISLPTSLTETNAFELAYKVGEIFIPIDLVAGKVQKLLNTIHLVNNDGKEITIPTNVAKLLDTPNIYCSLSDIVYNYVFSKMADGNSYLYPYTAAQNATQDTITGLFLLEPDAVTIQYKSDNKKIFTAKSKSEMIDYYLYSVNSEKIKPDSIVHSRYSFITGNKSGFSLKAKSPLFAAQQNIDNLLAAYSARYNIFVNNGSAIILTPEKVDGNSLASAVDPVTKEQIEKELNARKGLVGTKQIKAIASMPLKAINTLATIKDLEPYVESYADMEIIGGIFEIDKDLLPRREGTTYNNKEVAEDKLWHDVVIPMADDFCKDLEMALRIKDAKFAYKTDSIGFLASKVKTEYEADKQLIDNLSSLNGIYPDDPRIKNALNKLIDKYGKQV